MSIDPSFIPATPGTPLGAVPVPLPQTPAPGAPLFNGEGFSFGDVLDLINPLQHLPVISTFYRDLTGNEIDAGARVLGGALFGCIPGVVGSLANVVIEDEIGKDFGEHVPALFDDPAGEVSKTAYAAVDRFDITPGTKDAQARSVALVADLAPATALAAAPSTSPETASIRLAAGKANWDRTAPAAASAHAATTLMANIAHDACRTADAARGGTTARTGSYA